MITKKIKKIIASALVLALVLSIAPVQNTPILGQDIKTMASTANPTIPSLGNLGTVEFYGGKEESGNWVQTKINGKAVFCLNLGKRCSRYYTYAAQSSVVYTSNDSNLKHSLYAKIGYWWDVEKKQSNKAWVYAQCLIWDIEEGCLESSDYESELQGIIRKVRSNTGYYDNKTYKEIYSEIFDTDKTIETTVTMWNYTGEDDKAVQKLMEVESDTLPDYKTLSDTLKYRQRITLTKTDDLGLVMPKAEFHMEVKNYKDLVSAKINGYGEAETEDADDADDVLEWDNQTDSNGRITYKFTYELNSCEYVYIKDSELEDLTSEEKQILRDEFDDMGLLYANNLSKSGAEKLIESDLQDQFNDISNKYVITETSSGNNNILIDSNYQSPGKTITLKTDSSWTKGDDGWPDTAYEKSYEYPLAYQLGITDKRKKVTVSVVKKDGYSDDGTSHGDAALDGIAYGLYSDKECGQRAYVYDENGNSFESGDYYLESVKDNGANIEYSFETDYILCGEDYWLKETKTNDSYLLSDEVYKVSESDDNNTLTVEFTQNFDTVHVSDNPVLGKVALRKVISDGATGNALYEDGAKFQVYLKSKGSYDLCDKYECDTITTDEFGYAVTCDLYYGTYIVHQISSGDYDVEYIDDFEVKIDEDGRTYSYLLNNSPFTAYLRIIKKDGDTGKTVLKSDTAYRIYSIDENGERTLVTQSYSDGFGMKEVSTFYTDDTGEIMTVSPLPSGTYRIYEADSATGLYITTEYIEITIGSGEDNYETFTDENGDTYSVITVYYTNYEAKGWLKIEKTGEMLKGYDDINEDGDKDFIYEDSYLFGQVFKIYAKTDVKTQDGQDNNWFDEGELVATITTGEGAVFTKECSDILSFEVDETTGAVAVTLPLGRYTVKEEETLYGYALSDTNEWDVEFVYKDADTPVVINSTSVTDENGLLSIKNERAKGNVSILKTDAATGKTVEGVTYGLYALDDIYNENGELIVEKGTKLETIVTGADGYAYSKISLPLMSEKYQSAYADEKSDTAYDFDAQDEKVDKKEYEDEGVDEKVDFYEEIDSNRETVSDEVTTLDEEIDSQEEQNFDDDIENISTNDGINSGNFYLVEEDTPDSYYVDESPIEVHLEYMDIETPIVRVEAAQSDAQTESVFSKQTLGGDELFGCELEILDADDKNIISWTSGDESSISINEDEISSQENDKGYRNLSAQMNEDGQLVIYGLLNNEEYTMTETVPAKGYVTANNISFMLKESEDETGKTLMLVKNDDGEYENISEKAVTMYDDTTKISFSKIASDTKKLLKGASYKVYDKSGNEVYSFTTTDEEEKLESVLSIGETYTFHEESAPTGYNVAKDVEYTVKDTGKIQYIEVTDDYIPTSPKTGVYVKRSISGILVLITVLGIGGYGAWQKKRRKAVC